MIYIADTSTPITMLVPRTSKAPAEGAALELVSTVDRVVYVIPLTEVSDEGDYYAISGDFSAIKTSGEYEYHLRAGEENLAAGVAVVGELPAIVPEQYVKATEYQQYEQD